jgi:hypothetical protein
MLWFTDSGCTSAATTADSVDSGVILPEGSYVVVPFNVSPPTGATHFKTRFEVRDDNGGTNAEDDWAADDVLVQQ